MYATEQDATSNFSGELVESRTCTLLWAFERESSMRLRALGHLEQEGFTVWTLPIEPNFIQRVRQFHPYLVIIEAVTPGESILQLCRGIRRLPSFVRTPLILVSANASEEERVRGLESGADDYLTEASTGREIVARVRALIRRFMRDDVGFEVPNAVRTFLQYPSSGLGPNIRIGDIEIDAASMIISVRGRVIETTNLEFRLFCYLVLNHGRVFTRDELLNAVWDAEFVESRSVDACIRRLRRKIEPQPVQPIYLKTLRGAGYYLRATSA